MFGVGWLKDVFMMRVTVFYIRFTHVIRNRVALIMREQRFELGEDKEVLLRNEGRDLRNKLCDFEKEGSDPRKYSHVRRDP